jgi:hypothetical protein
MGYPDPARDIMTATSESLVASPTAIFGIPV